MPETQIIKADLNLAKVRELLHSPGISNAIAKAAPKHLTVERMIQVALNMVRKTKNLREADPFSVVASIVEASQLGLECDNVLGHAYLVAFNNRKLGKKMCQLIVGYRGFQQLAYNTGTVNSVTAELVRKADEFQLMLGTNRQLHHVPKLDAPGRLDEKNWIGAYATIQFKDGGYDFEYMTAEEINATRARSRAADDGPWVTDTGEMWKKTCVRKLAKRMPKSAENRMLIRAAIADEYREAGMHVSHADHADLTTGGVAQIVDELILESGDSIDISSGDAELAQEVERKEPQRKSETGAKADDKKDAKTTVSQGQQRNSRPGNQGSAPGPAGNKGSAAQKPAKTPATTRINPGQVSAIRGIANERKIPDEAIVEMLRKFNAEQTSDLLSTDFGAFWQELFAWGVKAKK